MHNISNFVRTVSSSIMVAMIIPTSWWLQSNRLSSDIKFLVFD